MLVLDPAHHAALVAHALRGFPLEACGLLGGEESPGGGADGVGTVRRFYPCENAAASGKLYTVAPRDHLRADRDAEHHGWQIIGVVHSHTHTDAYPSATDVEQAPDPAWHYVIVSLRDEEPSVRSYRIVDGVITEEPVVVPGLD